MRYMEIYNKKQENQTEKSNRTNTNSKTTCNNRDVILQWLEYSTAG